MNTDNKNNNTIDNFKPRRDSVLYRVISTVDATANQSLYDTELIQEPNELTATNDCINYVGVLNDTNIKAIDDDNSDDNYLQSTNNQITEETQHLLDNNSIFNSAETVTTASKVHYLLPHHLKVNSSHSLDRRKQSMYKFVLDNSLNKDPTPATQETCTSTGASFVFNERHNDSSATVVGNVRKGIYENDTSYIFLRSKSNQFHSQQFNVNTGNKRLTINVSGIRYETYTGTLKLIPESRLANLSETNSDYDPIKNEYFFDRHPGAFIAILNYYRTGKLHSPPDLCGNQFYEELNFWGITQYAIEPCCWTGYSQQRDADEKLRQITENIETEDGEEMDDILHLQKVSSLLHVPASEIFHNRKNCFLRLYFRLRPKIWRFFDDRNSSKPALVFFWISVLFLFASLVNFVLETSSYFREPYEIATNYSIPRSQREELTQPHHILKQIEVFCNAFFTIEIAIRFLFSPNKIKFLHNPYNVLEFLAILPFFFPVQSKDGPKTWAVKAHNYLEVFYILRILRIFALVPKYSGLRVLLLTIKTSLGELFLYVLLLLMTLMVFASFVFYAEQIYEVDNNPFDSIIIGLWWAIVTMTTLGYGDIVPVTPFGRLVGALCALCGLVFLALPIPVIVNNFTTYYAQAKAHQKLRSYVAEKKGLFNRAIALHLNTLPMSDPGVNNNQSLFAEQDDDKKETSDSGVQTTIHKNNELITFEKYHQEIETFHINRTHSDDKLSQSNLTKCLWCKNSGIRLKKKDPNYDATQKFNSIILQISLT